MERQSRQVLGVDPASLVSLIWFILVFVVLFWFYSSIRRIERVLLDIKKALEANQPRTA